MTRILYLASYMPKYREAYINELGKHVDLKIIAAPPELGGHVPMVIGPDRNVTIEYCMNARATRIAFSTKAIRAILKKDWDIIICAYAPRSLDRWLVPFFSKRRLIWVGPIIDRRNTIIHLLFRHILLSNSSGILTYHKAIADRLRDESSRYPAIDSINNSSCSKHDCEYLPFSKIQKQVNVLYVGRPQRRKGIDQLIELTKRNHNIKLRLVGPGMPEWYGQNHQPYADISVFPAAFSDELRGHMMWSHVVATKGVGLLVVTAGQHRRPLLYASNAHHGSEVNVAHESNQFCVDFDSIDEMKRWFDWAVEHQNELEEAADRLYKLVIEEYTAEYAVQKVLRMINTVLSNDKSPHPSQ